MAKQISVAIFRSGLLGDTLVSIPALELVRHHFPNARVVYVTNKVKTFDSSYAKQVLYPLGLVDAVFEYDNSGKLNAAIDGIRMIFSLRQRKIDYAIVLEEGHWKSNRTLISKLIGAKKTYSPSGNTSEFPRDNNGNLLAIPKISSQLAAIVAEVLGIPNSIFTHSLRVPKEIGSAATQWVKNNAPNTSAQLIAVSTGSNMQAKRWPYYDQVLRPLIKEFNVIPVFFGTKSERDMAETFIASCGAGVNACGELKILEIAEIMKSCSLYLGNDSGLMHLASFVGIQCVALFSAHNSPGRWYPYGTGHAVLRKTVPCEGCVKRECSQNPRCIDLIQVEEVLSACRERLAHRKVPR